VFQRRTSGSVVCPSCGSLVGVRDDKCYTCGRSNPGLWGFGPALRNLGVSFGFAPTVIGICVTVWVVMLLLSGGAIGSGSFLSALSPSPAVLFLFGESGAVPVFQAGRWWTVLSAGWLHAGLLHIAMNMYWLYMMGPAITELFGPARTVIIYTVGGVAGFFLSSLAGLVLYWMPLPFLQPGAFTVGASAPLFGLIGALYHYGRTMSSAVRQQALSIIVQAVLFGLLIRGIDNYAHLGGFAGGYLTSAFLNPMSRERGDHMLIAVICLAASFLSIVVSIVTGLHLIR
jgi:membrane associated rhomboid family serine protease